MSYQRGFIQIFAIIGGLLLLVAGGYFVVSDRGLSGEQIQVPLPESEIASTTSTTETPLTLERQKVPEKKVEEPKTPPPASQTFDAAIHDVKYFYDTVKIPAEGYVRSGYKNEVRVRGTLIVTKPEALCQPGVQCPSQADPSVWRYSIENAQDYIQNSRYRISIRKTGDPIATGLKEGQVYVFTGTLEHSFNTADQVNFVFDPKSAE
jgi:hypothetical protein